jgi:hypothetical protein
VLYILQLSKLSLPRSAVRVWTPVSKNIRVYLHDSDPARDSHAFRISRNDAVSRLAAGYVRYLSPNAVQLKPPPDWKPEIDYRGLFDKVWQPRPSAHYLVWQMRPTLSDSEKLDENRPVD